MSDYPGPSLILTRILPAPREKVFAAWTDPESIRHWMCPGSVKWAEAKLDVRVGGCFTIDMHADDEHFHHSGEYLEVQPPERLVFTWISSATDHKPSRVTVELRQQGNETELRLTHEGLPSQELADKHRNGWSQIADRLAQHLSTST